MIIFNPKAPGETVAYTIDWSDIGDDVIATSVLTVDTGDAVLGVNSFVCNMVFLLISGGTTETTTTITNDITTLGGQILSRAASLYVVDGAVPAVPSTATKRLVVGLAFEECRLAGWEFDLTPDELNSALTKMDVLMDEWAVSGINLGYNSPFVPGHGDLEDEIGIPNAALHAVALYLALRVSPQMGKTLSPETRKALSDAMSNLRAMTISIPQMRLPRNTPIGSGNQGWLRGPFAYGSRQC